MATRPAWWPTQELDRIVAEHAVRGAAAHVSLRFLLVAFVVLTVTTNPPEFYYRGCLFLALAYAVWAVVVLVWFRTGPTRLVQLTWLVLTIDLLLFGALNQLTGVSADTPTWTAYILVNGFVLIPVLAAAQLRLGLTVMVGSGAVALYLLSSLAARDANDEPLSAVLLRSLVVAGVALGAVLLTAVQRGRSSAIGDLARQRADLLRQLSDLENQERRELAENLHDGALQYLLGARFDLDDARDGDRAAVDRIDVALTESAQLLRSTVSELHPAVFRQAGLEQALRDLVDATAARAKLSAEFHADPSAEEAPPATTGTGPYDLVLYSTVRELLANVVKHARAHHLSVTLHRRDDTTTAVVADDGVGIAAGAVEQRLADGHIGLASHRVRLEAAGGSLVLAANRPRGTVAVASVPSN